jgi:predicted enzyme related to lactoylglutathione lyase
MRGDHSFMGDAKSICRQNTRGGNAMTEPQTPRWSVAPYFIVDDVVSTANYYRDKLGFHYDRFWGKPSCFAMVRRAGITIMLKQPEITGGMHPNRLIDPEDSSWDAYIWVDDADALYEEFQRAGVTVARPVCDQPYGCRDFDIRDCNGYTLCFGHTI